MNKLMCHVVAGYPDAKTCLELMKGMAERGVAAVEVQIPFSDPIADGETIMHANDAALEGGMTTAGSFKLIKAAGLRCDVYVMSYIQKAQRFGLNAFCEAATASGVKGLIIPDLPYDAPEYQELSACIGKLELVPVLSPGMPEARLKVVLTARPARVYVTSRRGITGNEYAGGRELEQIVQAIRKASKAEVMIGFGITTPEDVRNALKLGDIAVVGSAVIKRLQESGMPKTLGYISGLTGGTV